MDIPAGLLARPFFSYREARELGLNDADLRSAVRSGVLTRLKRGWYSGQVFRWPADLHAARTAVEILDHAGTRAASYSALSLAGLPIADRDLRVVQLRRLGVGRRQARGKVAIRESLPWDDEGSPLARDVVETALVDPLTALMAGDEALRTGAVSPAALSQWVTRLAFEPRGESAILVHSLVDGRRESPGESRSALVLHELGYATTPQVWVTARHGRYRLDLVLDGEWVALEFDGREKYGGLTGEPLWREKNREDDIRSVTWEVVRLTTPMLDDPAQVRAETEDARRRARRNHGDAIRRPRP